MILAILFFVVYKLDRGYQRHAEIRESYFATLMSAMIGADAREGDTLDDVLMRSEQQGGEQAIVFHMVLFNYGDPREQHLSDFLSLKWEGERGSMHWVLEEKSPMRVSLFEKDRLIMDEMGNIRWETGRPITSVKWNREK